MHLTDSSDSSFELKIAAYQYPNIHNDYYDSNWLMIQVDVKHPQGSWRASDPCLLTFEVEQLAQWLEEVKSNSNKISHCSFIEPCLEFRIVENNKGTNVLRVYFELKTRPPWAYARAAGQEDLWVEFALGEIDLFKAIQELRAQLQQYPQRVGR